MGSLTLFVAALAAGSAAAAPIVYTIDPASSIGVTLARACTVVSCSPSSTVVFSQSGVPDEVVGSLTIDTVALTLSFSLSSAVQHTGSSNGVTSVDFDPVSYVSNGNLTLVKPDPLVETYGINGALGPTAAVSGTLVENGGVVGPFSSPSVRVTGQCDVGATALCGLTFGTSGFQQGIGNPDESHFFQHTMNVTGVPEPGSALLLGLGVAGLAFARRGRVA
jgi:hypothetical protein